MAEAALAHDALEQAFAAARPELVRNLARLLGSSEDAQDAAQEAFLKCWRHRAQAGQVRDLRAWIFRVALNAGRDLRRNVWRRRHCSLTSPAALTDRPGACPDEHLLYNESVERVRQALARLRPEERDVFLLRQQSQLTYEQIAERSGLPVGTVKTRMRAALKALRLAFPEGGP